MLSRIPVSFPDPISFPVMPNWLLPENIADVLPSEARKIEELRRAIIDHFHLYGYELVMPPMLEYLESLLAGAGQDVDLRTFKLVDQLSGRTLGIRADMTTQVARIDAHLLNRPSITRLCYSGSVLHTRPSGLHATREPLQIGAEIYGHAGLEADAEIQELALASLASGRVSSTCVWILCHVGILRAILENDAECAKGRGGAYTPACVPRTCRSWKKSRPAMRPIRGVRLLALAGLYGDASVIERARKVLPELPGNQACTE
jgi:ATP phosphoribosyltransferase regulatory subunit